MKILDSVFKTLLSVTLVAGLLPVSAGALEEDASATAVTSAATTQTLSAALSSGETAADQPADAVASQSGEVTTEAAATEAAATEAATVDATASTTEAATPDAVAAATAATEATTAASATEATAASATVTTQAVPATQLTLDTAVTLVGSASAETVAYYQFSVTEDGYYSFEVGPGSRYDDITVSTMSDDFSSVTSTFGSQKGYFSGATYLKAGATGNFRVTLPSSEGAAAQAVSVVIRAKDTSHNDFYPSVGYTQSSEYCKSVKDASGYWRTGFYGLDAYHKVSYIQYWDYDADCNRNVTNDGSQFTEVFYDSTGAKVETPEYDTYTVLYAPTLTSDFYHSATFTAVLINPYDLAYATIYPKTGFASTSGTSTAPTVSMAYTTIKGSTTYLTEGTDYEVVGYRAASDGKTVTTFSTDLMTWVENSGGITLDTGETYAGGSYYTYMVVEGRGSYSGQAVIRASMYSDTTFATAYTSGTILADDDVSKILKVYSYASGSSRQLLTYGTDYDLVYYVNGVYTRTQPTTAGTYLYCVIPAKGSSYRGILDPRQITLKDSSNIANYCYTLTANGQTVSLADYVSTNQAYTPVFFTTGSAVKPVASCSMTSGSGRQFNLSASQLQYTYYNEAGEQVTPKAAGTYTIKIEPKAGSGLSGSVTYTFKLADVLNLDDLRQGAGSSAEGYVAVTVSDAVDKTYQTTTTSSGSYMSGLTYFVSSMEDLDITVTIAGIGRTLVEGVDYVVTTAWSTIRSGAEGLMALVQITGIGQYSGKVGNYNVQKIENYLGTDINSYVADNTTSTNYLDVYMHDPITGLVYDESYNAQVLASQAFYYSAVYVNDAQYQGQQYLYLNSDGSVQFPDVTVIGLTEGTDYVIAGIYDRASGNIGDLLLAPDSKTKWIPAKSADSTYLLKLVGKGDYEGKTRYVSVSVCTSDKVTTDYTVGIDGGMANTTSGSESIYILSSALMPSVAATTYTGSLTKDYAGQGYTFDYTTTKSKDGKTLSVLTARTDPYGTTTSQSLTATIVDQYDFSQLAMVDQTALDQITYAGVSYVPEFQVTANNTSIDSASANTQVKLSNGTSVSYEAQTLVFGTDYTLSALEKNGTAVSVTKGITGVGTYTATLTGKGNWTGSQTVTFTVISSGTTQDLSACSVTVDDEDLVYIGYALQPKVTVKLGLTTLKAGTDYVLTYINNDQAGRAAVKITPAEGSKFSGYAAANFTIVADMRADASGNGKVNIVDSQLAYDIACGMYKTRADYSLLYEACDVTGDGTVDAADARAIQVTALTGKFPTTPTV